MKQTRWCVWTLVPWMVLVASCGGGESDPLDDGTFAGMNEDRIRYDCNQTVQCKIQHGESLAEDPFATCVLDTARVLEAQPQKQGEFLTNFNRCAAFVVCEYRACALADIQGTYGQMHMAKVDYNCRQDVECRRQLGTLVGDPTTEINSCITNNVGVLDAFSPDMRAQYEAEFARCGATVACDFTNCFPF
jgi:hypothetical protein